MSFEEPVVRWYNIKNVLNCCLLAVWKHKGVLYSINIFRFWCMP